MLEMMIVVILSRVANNDCGGDVNDSGCDDDSCEDKQMVVIISSGYDGNYSGGSDDSCNG